ncbi:MAG: RNA ligase family protein [Enhygromyxa sp.]
MIKFSHIGQLHNVVQVVNARREFGVEIERVRYRGRVKLHGSNAAIVCRPDGLRAQSRNREITPEDDNLGFAGFALAEPTVAAVRELEAELRELTRLEREQPLALFGEWIGPGVQKGVGVAELSGRQWVLFAVATRGEDEDRKQYFELPSLGDRFAELGIYSIADGPQYSLELDFGSRAALELAADAIEEATAKIDERCPWAARFGVAGVGEGIVWQPLDRHFGDSELFFKSKGTRHQVAARKPKSQRKGSLLDPEQLASVEAFVAYAVTGPRLAQGLDYLREQGLAVEMRSLGAYLQWLAADIRRECAAELEHSELEWKQVARPINEAAKTFFRRALIGDLG